MSTIIMHNSDFDTNVHESLVMEFAIIDDIVEYIERVYDGDDTIRDTIRRFMDGDYETTKRCSEEYWSTVLI